MASTAYGSQHQRTRDQWAPIVAGGTTVCSRFNQDPKCPGVIEPGTPWDLDHTDDGTAYLGPSHESCNARAGALKRLGRLPTADTIKTYTWGRAGQNSTG